MFTGGEGGGVQGQYYLFDAGMSPVKVTPRMLRVHMKGKAGDKTSLQCDVDMRCVTAMKAKPGDKTSLKRDVDMPCLPVC